MAELRQAPVPPASSASVTIPALLVATLLLIVIGFVGIGWLSVQVPAPHTDVDREVAAKLLAAGALQQAGQRYEVVLRDTTVEAPIRARIAFSLGSRWLERGSYEEALRWFYEAEVAGDVETAAEAATKVVHCLERLGRVHEAEAVLASRTTLTDPVSHADTDPVVAEIGPREIRASELDRALDDLPPQFAERFATSEGRRAFLEKYVADEMLWSKAQKLEYTDDPEVRKQLEMAVKQIVLSTFVEREIVGKVNATEGELQTWYQAHAQQYVNEDGTPKAFEEVRDQVARAHRQQRMQEAWQSLVEEQLSAAEVQLHPDRWETAK